jgi:hypothetical protein
VHETVAVWLSGGEQRAKTTVHIHAKTRSLGACARTLPSTLLRRRVREQGKAHCTHARSHARTHARTHTHRSSIVSLLHHTYFIFNAIPSPLTFSFSHTTTCLSTIPPLHLHINSSVASLYRTERKREIYSSNTWFDHDDEQHHHHHHQPVTASFCSSSTLLVGRNNKGYVRIYYCMTTASPMSCTSVPPMQCFPSFAEAPNPAHALPLAMLPYDAPHNHLQTDHDHN